MADPVVKIPTNTPHPGGRIFCVPLLLSRGKYICIMDAASTPVDPEEGTDISIPGNDTKKDTEPPVRTHQRDKEADTEEKPLESTPSLSVSKMRVLQHRV